MSLRSQIKLGLALQEARKKSYKELKLADVITAAGGKDAIKSKFKYAEDAYDHLSDHHEKLIRQHLNTHEEVGNISNTAMMDWCDSHFESKGTNESVATTYYYEFYGNKTGINNRIPICPDCSLPVNETFGNRHPMASGLSALQCQCKRRAA